MNLSILEPEFGLGALARHLLVIGQPLGVESKLLREPLDVGGGLLVAGFELLGLLLCLDQRCLQLIDFVLKRCGIDPKKYRAALHRNVWLHRYGDDLTGYVGRDLYDAGYDHEASPRRQIIEHRQKHGENEHSEEHSKRAGKPPSRQWQGGRGTTEDSRGHD